MKRKVTSSVIAASLAVLVTLFPAPCHAMQSSTEVTIASAEGMGTATDPSNETVTVDVGKGSQAPLSTTGDAAPALAAFLAGAGASSIGLAAVKEEGKENEDGRA